MMAGKELYSVEDIALMDVDGELCLRDGGTLYRIHSHPYEPCTYLVQEGNIAATIHNAFESSTIRRVAEERQPIRAVTGAEYDADRLCRFLAFAMKELGATSPETAVGMSELGVRTISDAFSHSKKLTERVMRTENGKVYVQIKR